MNELNLTPKQKNMIFIISLGLVLAILWSIFTGVDNSGKRTLTVVVVPATASISINGIQASDSTLLYPGTYEVTVKADGFVTQTQSVTIETDFSLPALLAPSSDVAKKWAEENIEIYGEGYDPRSTYHPIQNQLPYEDSIFSISSKDVSAEKDIITLDLVTLPGYRNAPINKIKSMGFNPEDYIYNFDYRNPFENE